MLSIIAICDYRQVSQPFTSSLFHRRVLTASGYPAGFILLSLASYAPLSTLLLAFGLS